jgi:two-component system cell cycle sensor histidine kinase/response regulator CckA
MAIPLRVLIVRDSEDDSQLAARELERAGYEADWKWVNSLDGLAKLCDLGKWDVIISDVSFAHFSGADALEMVRSRAMDTPFVFILGAAGEELGALAPKESEQSYLVKSDLRGLAPAVQRELKEYADRLEHVRLEKSVQHLLKFEAIGRLSGGIAHDFNNMIGAIIGWAELGCQETRAGSKSHVRFEKIREQSQRAANLTSQLLAFGRKQVLQPRILDLNVLIREEMAFLGRVIEKDIEIRVILDPILRVTHADPTQIQQVLMNLCLNARDAMPHGGELIIETSNFEIDEEFKRNRPTAVPGSYVLLKVTDNGVGMDPDVAEQIFEPFFTTKELGRGSGLGLATVYGIVKQHGGSIYVQSTKGRGSSFEVYLPASAGEHEPIESSQNQQEVAGTGTILLAEDHDGLRESAQEMLHALGYEVIAVGTGTKAVGVFKENAQRINLVMMDIVMPGLGGPDAYVQMCKIRTGVPVIFTSGYAPKSETLLSLLDQKAEFVQKPYDYPKLSRIIHEAMGSSGPVGPRDRHHESATVT